MLAFCDRNFSSAQRKTFRRFTLLNLVAQEHIMKMILVKNLVAVILFGIFSHFSVAQNPAAIEALREISRIVATINHFPSDADKTALKNISENDNVPQGVRMIAGAVISINHSPSDESKQMMARLQSAAQAPDRVKSLAKIIADFNHMPSNEDKETLSQLFF